MSPSDATRTPVGSKAQLTNASHQHSVALLSFLVQLWYFQLYSTWASSHRRYLAARLVSRLKEFLEGVQFVQVEIAQTLCSMLRNRSQMLIRLEMTGHEMCRICYLIEPL